MGGQGQCWPGGRLFAAWLAVASGLVCGLHFSVTKKVVTNREFLVGLQVLKRNRMDGSNN